LRAGGASRRWVPKSSRKVLNPRAFDRFDKMVRRYFLRGRSHLISNKSKPAKFPDKFRSLKADTQYWNPDPRSRAVGIVRISPTS